MYMLQAASDNPHQQHRIFRQQRTPPVAAPTRSIDSKRYRAALKQSLGRILDESEEAGWNTWVAKNPCHTDMNRLIVKTTESIGFRIRAAVVLLVPDVRRFDLFERPPCDGYRNLLHIVRGWLPHAGKFPKRESEFLGKLLLLSAHSELAQDKDVLAYAWCIAEAFDWKASASLKKKLAEFLLSALPFIRQEDSALFARVKQALRTHDHSMAR
jgi:hypothetical protein